MDLYRYYENVPIYQVLVRIRLTQNTDTPTTDWNVFWRPQRYTSALLISHATFFGSIRRHFSRCCARTLNTNTQGSRPFIHHSTILRQRKTHPARTQRKPNQESCRSDRRGIHRNDRRSDQPAQLSVVATMATVIHQIDFSERDVGKMNPESKREVIFRFSINGKEYDLLLVWSFASGKQSIFVNGVEEVFTRNSGASIVDKTFEFDGFNFQLIGTRTRPKGGSYTYHCFELLIDGVLLSNCPMEGSTKPPPSTEGDSILDLLYPNHPARNRAPPVASVPHAHMYAHVQPNASAYQIDAPPQLHNAAPAPPTPATDLLLDFNPIPPTNNAHNAYNVHNAHNAPSNDLLTQVEHQPVYNNYTLPTADPAAANQFGGSPSLQMGTYYGAPTSNTPAPAGNPFDAPPSMQMGTYYGAPTNAGEGNPFESNNTTNPYGQYSSTGPYNTATANGNQNPPTNTGDLFGF